MSTDVEKTLNALTLTRLKDVHQTLGLLLPNALKKSEVIKRIADAPGFNYQGSLREFTRAELQIACRENELDDSGRSRIQLARRLLSDVDESAFGTLGQDVTDVSLHERGLPSPGQVVLCRQRQYLVESVDARSPGIAPITKVRLVCLDDDSPGRILEVMWERELGARVIETTSGDIGKIESIDRPRYFAAYLNALRWNCVTATNPKLFQSPFRAGIQIFDHQMIPLQKALQLPRANLFIADDVGLGKTIEAGLVLQELILRQRVNFTLIVCPASVVLQWRDEMSKRFGHASRKVPRWARRTRTFDKLRERFV